MAGSVGGAPARVFISYRREDTALAAAWLYERLVRHFSPDQVFKDVDSIELGQEFPKVIAKAVGSCDVLLALIGDRWLSITDKDGRRRIDRPDDFVHLEIEAALNRNVRVIPILVQGASMPRQDELPTSLVRIVDRHGLELGSSDFDADVNRLCRVLDKIVGDEPPEPVQPSKPAARKPRRTGSARGALSRWVRAHRALATAILVAMIGALVGGAVLIANVRQNPVLALVVDVPGTETWTDTGIFVREGERITITASGQVLHYYKDKRTAVGPDGDVGRDLRKNNLMRSENHAALIGKVNDQGQYFLVGQHYTGRVSQTGRLLLRVNDTNVHDNSGKFTARIEVTRP